MNKKTLLAGVFAAALVLGGGASASAAEPIPVSPQVIVIDECGTERDRVRPIQVRGVVYNVQTGPGYAVVRANAEPGYVIVPEDPFFYNPHAEGATAYIAFTNVPCSTVPRNPRA